MRLRSLPEIVTTISFGDEILVGIDDFARDRRARITISVADLDEPVDDDLMSTASSPRIARRRAIIAGV